MDRVCLCSILHSAPVKKNFNGSSYIFYGNVIGKSYKWVGSKKNCEQSGSNLVSIESRAEWEFLKKIILKENTIEYFVGLRKDKPTGVWRWLSDNSTVNASSEGRWPWAVGEPSNRRNTHEENCAQMYGKYEDNYGRYNDVSCTSPNARAGFICELRGGGGNRRPSPSLESQLHRGRKLKRWNNIV